MTAGFYQKRRRAWVFKGTRTPLATVFENLQDIEFGVTREQVQTVLAGRRIAVVVLGKGRWSLMRPHVAQIVAAVDAATPGSFAEVDIPE